MTVLLLHVAATWALVGLVWLVQLVVYPSFALVDARELPALHEAHCRRITWVVAPLMAVELVTGGLLLADAPVGASPPVLWAGAGLIAVNWASTAFVSVPLHSRLAGPDRARVQRRLVATNWIRTTAWSVRGALVLSLLA